MVVKLLGAKRAVAMRNPFARCLLIASCVLLILIAVLRHDKTTPRTRFSSKVGVKSSSIPRKRPLDDADSPFAQAPLSSGGNDLNCTVDVAHLADIKRRYELGDKIQYLKRHVRFSRKPDLVRKRMTRLSQKLLPGDIRTVDVTAKTQPDDDTCFEPLAVDVTESGLPSTVNASDFMFGVSTSYKRFMDSATTPINEWIFWLTDGRGHSNGGKLLLMLLDASNGELQEVANLLGDVGIDVDLYHSDSSVEMAVRYLNLVPTLYTHAEAQKKKWLVTCDDDTFFPSMHALVDKFNTFDHTMQMYIGTLSEDVGAVERHGSQAFGGAGVFLSLPMADKITDLYTSCSTEEKVRESNSGWGPQGDILLRKCIYENTETRLTTLWDLWQLDFYGDPAGFYEWGIKPLSLHHYRGGGWHKANPGQFAKIAHSCGEDCIMQRFQTADDFIISGYSIAHYPEGIGFDTNQMESTLHAAPEDKQWNLDFMFGPQRPSLEKTGRKISWELQESEAGLDGSVLQTYTRKKDDERWVSKDGQPMSNIDGVFELVWLPS